MGVADAAERHDEYLGRALHDEMRGDLEAMTCSSTRRPMWLPPAIAARVTMAKRTRSSVGPAETAIEIVTTNYVRTRSLAC